MTLERSSVWVSKDSDEERHKDVWEGGAQGDSRAHFTFIFVPQLGIRHPRARSTVLKPDRLLAKNATSAPRPTKQHCAQSVARAVCRYLSKLEIRLLGRNRRFHPAKVLGTHWILILKFGSECNRHAQRVALG